MNTIADRRANEYNSFATASWILDSCTGKNHSYTTASFYSDCNEAIDMYWGQYPVAVRERILTPDENIKYNLDVTFRATGELRKIIYNVVALVYIRRDKNHNLFGYSVVNMGKLKNYLLAVGFTGNNWWKRTNGFVSYINYDKSAEPFYVFDFSKQPELLLDHA